jgi:hypothetical protein
LRAFKETVEKSGSGGNLGDDFGDRLASGATAAAGDAREDLRFAIASVTALELLL